MKKSLSLLFASTALSLSLGLPALAAMSAQQGQSLTCANEICAAGLGGFDQTDLIRVSGDDDDHDDDDDDDGWFQGGDDDDGEEDCDEGDDDDRGDDDDGECLTPGKNPAPAGKAAPPANGLFGNGAPPVAVTK